ncbi:MAG: glycosyltransferase family 2 protein [Candidatus Micrarchaeota archaeon]|nr:glycosyltransferase family 2 protein [Candidatus Micrarchaeota archaeon]
MWSLIVFCPAHNVEKSIAELVERVSRVSKELKKDCVILKIMLVVDDGSSDSTKEILSALAKKHRFLRAVRNRTNKGPVFAVLRGMALSIAAAKRMGLNLEKTIFVRMDSDLEHQPEDIPRVIAPVIGGKADVCAGWLPFDSRSGKGYAEFNRQVGSQDSWKFLGLRLPQFCPGFYAMRGRWFAALAARLRREARLFRKRYGADMAGIDFALLARANEAGWKIAEVKLRKIQDRWVEKKRGKKLVAYLEHRKKLVEFLQG